MQRILLSSAWSGPPGFDRSATAPSNPALDFATRIPCRVTSDGKRGCASETRFWVCTAAMSGLAEVSNVRMICELPSEAEVDVK